MAENLIAGTKLEKSTDQEFCLRRRPSRKIYWRDICSTAQSLQQIAQGGSDHPSNAFQLNKVSNFYLTQRAVYAPQTRISQLFKTKCLPLSIVNASCREKCVKTW